LALERYSQPWPCAILVSFSGNFVPLRFSPIVFFLKDSLQIRDERIRKLQEEKGEITKELFSKDDGPSALSHFFDLKNITDGFKAVFKPRPGGVRTILLILFFCFEMEMLINVGDWGVAYLYFKRVLDFTLGDFTRCNSILHLALDQSKL